MLILREVAGNRLGFIACSNSANPFIDYIASLSDVLDATSFSADQINHAFCFAVELSVAF